MPTRRSTRAEAGSATQGLEVAFHRAILKLASLVEANQVNEAGTTISDFKAHYSSVLDRADNGSLEVITRNNRRYVILSEGQVVALVKNALPQPLAGELLADLPLLPYDEHRPRAQSINTVNSGRLSK